MGNNASKPGGGGQTRNTGLGDSGGNKAYRPGGNFWDFQSKPVAGDNALLRTAGRGAMNLGGAGSGYMNQSNDYLKQLAGGGSGYFDKAISAAGGALGPNQGFNKASDLMGQLQGVSRQQVTGKNLASDPALAAARKNFTQNMMPGIQNQTALMGLGRSNTAQNAMSLARSNAEIPFIQDALSREGQGIDRQMNALGTGVQTAMGQGGAQQQGQLSQRENQLRSLMGAGSQEANNLSTAAAGSAGLGQQAFGNAANASNQQWQMGQEARGNTQQRLDAPYNEQQRLWSEALNSMYGPLSMLGGQMGSTATSSGGGKK